MNLINDLIISLGYFVWYLIFMRNLFLELLNFMFLFFRRGDILNKVFTLVKFGKDSIVRDSPPNKMVQVSDWKNDPEYENYLQ